ATELALRDIHEAVQDGPPLILAEPLDVREPFVQQSDTACVQCVCPAYLVILNHFERFRAPEISLERRSIERVGYGIESADRGDCQFVEKRLRRLVKRIALADHLQHVPEQRNVPTGNEQGRDLA